MFEIILQHVIEFCLQSVIESGISKFSKLHLSFSCLQHLSEKKLSTFSLQVYIIRLSNRVFLLPLASVFMLQQHSDTVWEKRHSSSLMIASQIVDSKLERKSDFCLLLANIVSVRCDRKISAQRLRNISPPKISWSVQFI